MDPLDALRPYAHENKPEVIHHQVLRAWLRGHWFLPLRYIHMTLQVRTSTTIHGSVQHPICSHPVNVVDPSPPQGVVSERWSRSLGRCYCWTCYISSNNVSSGTIPFPIAGIDSDFINACLRNNPFLNFKSSVGLRYPSCNLSPR